MKRKKIVKVISLVLASILFVFGCFFTYVYYVMYYSLLPTEGEFKESAHYINPDEAILNENFKICNENYILQYYNQSKILPYLKGKNGFRDYINENYENQNYSDSGYFNIRFIINCDGKAGRFITHENNLDLEPHAFNLDLKKQLINITTKVKEWRPIFIRNENRDAYMYVSYRIENGEITEIIP